MGGVADIFTPLTIVSLLGAGVTFYQLVLHWRDFWSSNLTPTVQRLVGGVAFFLLLPIGVLLHEFGHMLAAWSTGSSVLGLHYFGYWGYVQYSPSSDSQLLQWYVALAGNFVSYLIGIVSIAAALFWPNLKPVLKLVLYQLGILQLVQTLIFYPLLSLDPDFAGDWDSIYSFQVPVASGLTLFVHLVSLAAFVYMLRTPRKIPAYE